MTDNLTFNLTKGGEFNLTKQRPTLRKIRVELSWSKPQKPLPGGHDFDADLSCFVLSNATGKPLLIGKPYFVYFNQLETPEKAITRTPDETSGGKEIFYVDLKALPEAADEVSWICNIHEAAKRGQHFGMISDIEIRMFDDETGECFLQIDMDENFDGQTAVQIGSLAEDQATKDWTFKNISQGYVLDITAFINKYLGR
jgi:stress response protein SCP2